MDKGTTQLLPLSTQKWIVEQVRLAKKVVIVEVDSRYYAGFPSGRIVDLTPYGGRVPGNIAQLEGICEW